MQTGERRGGVAAALHQPEMLLLTRVRAGSGLTLSLCAAEEVS